MRERAAVRPRVRWLALLVVVPVLLGAWGTWRAYELRRDLRAAQAGVERLQDALRRSPGRLPGAELDRTASQVRAAHSAAHDPVLVAAGVLPGPPGDLATVRHLTDVLSTLTTRVLPPAREAAARVAAGDLVVGGRVDLSELAALDEPVARAEAGLELARQQDADIRVPGRLAAVRAGRVRLTAAIADLGSALRAARGATQLGPAMLGAQAPRRYLVAVQNNAESRATGGLVGGFAVVRADAGRITLERTGTDADLEQESPRPVVPMPPAFAARYDRWGGRQAFFAANLSPHFPDVARVLAGLYRSQVPGALDGVVMLDPRALADVLRATGPVTFGGGQRVDGDSVVRFVLHDEYVRYPTAADAAARKKLLVDLSGATFRSVLSSRAPAARLLSALKDATTSGHLMLASLHPDEEGLLGSTRIGGGLPDTPRPFLQVLTQNVAGNKLDYYLRRRVGVRVLPGGQQDGATMELTLDLDLDLPAAALPPYVTVRSDRPAGPVPYGQDVLQLTVYAGTGARFRGGTLDGAPLLYGPGLEHGHPLADVPVTLTPHVPRVLVLRLAQPPGRLLYRQQPLAVDDTLTVDAPFDLG